MTEIEKSPGQQLNDRDDIDLIIEAPWISGISEEDLRHTLSENETDEELCQSL